MNIYLIGYRCTGKTTVGKLLSEMLNWPLSDSDAAVEKEYNTTISEMVEYDGWDKFRERERKMIRELSFLNRSVISTGGGVVLNKSNISNLRKSGVVVWLEASKDTIIKRILNDEKTSSQRPALLNTDLETEVNETLSKRMPLYERTSDFSIDTDKIDLAEIPVKIVETIKKRGLKL